ncbi:FAD-binding oxidoreductase [Streptomyces malaysiensis]|uniref:FAD-binding protein n=1 Tax=Streptomyces malaysiensis subsp. samsunensis TaxID=459658 RepID=A0A9X2M5G6_STRMQ|nr:FAD-linked oxidase C-terminal domain-containing protein [Streptomyces samsunensis]MCQ8835479.1 FAD-binding protein [Streptomyces samsunensis]
MREFLKQLTTAVAWATTEPHAMQAYRQDQCLIAEAGQPLAVVRPATVGEVVAVVDLCRTHAVPLVPRGAGTGLAGGANALDGCVLLLLDAMDQILEIDQVAQSARVQPGVVNADLDKAAGEVGLWYAPDPGSRALSSIGGNVATNAGGMCCAKYGVTRDHILALTAVLGTGEVLRTGTATRKDVAGLDLKHLLIGSEGTLGVIVEATVRLRPRPQRLSTVAATFPTVQSAIDVVQAFGREFNAAATELMDRTTVCAVNAMTQMGLDEAAGAVLIAQFDGADASQQAERCAAMAEGAGAEAFATDDQDDGSALMEARRAALPSLERMGSTLLDDVCVTPHRLPALIDAIERIALSHGVTIGTFGHAADGNLHPTIVFDPADDRQRVAAAAAFDAIIAAALDLGGTATGEHGVGSLKTPYIRRQVGDVGTSLMHRIKAAFDPSGILNPGRGY